MWRRRRSVSRVLLVFALLCSLELAAACFLHPPRITIVEHPTRFWTLSPSTNFPQDGLPMRVNSLGLRGDEPDLYSEGPRMLVLGDSCIFGVSLPNEATLDRFLERELRQATGQRWQVFNGGVPGYTTYQGLDLLEEIGPKLRPDIVLACYLCNDMSLDQDSDHRRMAGWPVSDLRRALWKSAFYHVLRAHLLGFPVGHPQLPVMNRPGDIPRVPVDQYRENLRQLARRSRAMGATTVAFLRLPDRVKKVGPPGGAIYGDELLAVAAEEGGLPLDAYAVWQKAGRDSDEVFLPDDPNHFTVLGNQILARDVVRLWLERHPESLGPSKAAPGKSS